MEAHMAKKYIGIAVSDTRIVGVEGYMKEGQIVISGAIEMPCRVGNLEEDIQLFIKRFSLEDMFVAIAAKSEVKTIYRQLPTMTYQEVDKLLTFQGKEFFSSPVEDYYAQFLLRAPARSKEDNGTVEEHPNSIMDIFIVALEKKIVQSLSKGIAKGKGLVEIIDYWPAGCTKALTEVTDGVLVLLSEKTARLSLWNDQMLVEEVLVDSSPQSVALALETMNEKVLENFATPLSGIIILLEDDSKIELDEDWRAIQENFGSWERRKVHTLPSASRWIEPNSVTWMIAMGLLIRQLEECTVKYSST